MTITGKKKNILLITLIFLITLLLLGSIPLLGWLFREPEPTYNFIFADASLSHDIYTDEDYLGLDRSIYYATNTGGYDFVTAIEDETSYNEAVQLLIRWVRAAIAGDATAYNACFSTEYLKKSGPVNDFTMQKIYDICITRYALSSDTNIPDGYEQIFVYGVSYKIKDNNGSLRNDMGSDSSHEQYVSVVIDKNHQAWIYGVQVRNYRSIG